MGWKVYLLPFGPLNISVYCGTPGPLLALTSQWSLVDFKKRVLKPLRNIQNVLTANFEFTQQSESLKQPIINQSINQNNHQPLDSVFLASRDSDSTECGETKERDTWDVGRGPHPIPGGHSFTPQVLQPCASLVGLFSVLIPQSLPPS